MTKVVRVALLLATLLFAGPASALNGPVLHLYNFAVGRTACLEIRPTQARVIAPAGTSSISAGWTHIVHMPDTNLIFFYNANSGSGAVAFNSGNCRYSTVGSFGPGHFSPGWTSITPAGGSRLLFYRTDGLTALATVAGDGAVSTIRSPVVRPRPVSVTVRRAVFPEGYTSVVKVRFGVFFYNSTSGDGEYGTFDTEGYYHRVGGMAGLFSPGWTKIVYIPASDRILYYNRGTGNAAIGQIDNAGNHTTIRSLPWATPGITQIVPTTGTSILLYDRVSGQMNFGAMTDTEFEQTTVSDLAGPGWTSIVYGS